jgi:hypothetical protein
MLEAARKYAERGWRVHPLHVGEKTPIAYRGVKDATTDIKQIEKWWETVPEANIGIATGPESGIFVLDVDPRNGGVSLISEYGAPDVFTGGGGEHYYFKWPDGIGKLKGQLRPGVDIKGAGGYVLAPPSKTTGDYIGKDPANYIPEPRDCPMELLIQIIARLEEERPGDNYNETKTWQDVIDDVLIPHGWQVESTEPDGSTRVTRPGKDGGISATIEFEGTDYFYCFTSSTEFEQGRAYDKFGVYTVLEHKGDHAAAAQALSGGGKRLHGSTDGSAVSGVQHGSNNTAPVPTRGAEFEPALPPSHFISRYVDYAGRLTDAAPEYHEAAALVLLSALSNSTRIELAPYPDGLSTNLYIALIGESSLSRKSTAQSIAKSMLNKIDNAVILPDAMTPESALVALAIRSGQSAAWMPDEMGLALQDIYRAGSYRSGLEDILLTLYSGQEYKTSTVGAGLRHISGLHLIIFGAATPESFAGAGRMASGGLLPRVAQVFPAEIPPWRPLSNSTYPAERQALEHELLQFRMWLNVPNQNSTVTVSQAALQEFANADHLFSGAAITTRLSTTMYKVGALIALADQRWQVSDSDAKAAIQIVSRWRDGAMRLRPYVSRSAGDIAFEALLSDVLLELKMAGITGMRGRTEVAKLLRLERRTLDRVRDTLEDRSQIGVITQNGEETWLIP